MRDGCGDMLGRWHDPSILIITRLLGISNTKEVTLHRSGKYVSVRVTNSKAVGTRQVSRIS